MENTSSTSSTPLHQYSTVPVYPVQTYPAKSTTPTVSRTASAGILGFVVVATGTMGANLSKVTDGQMTLVQATGDCLAKGAIGGTAAACASAASSTLTDGGVAGLAVTVAAATGVSYMINRMIS